MGSNQPQNVISPARGGAVLRLVVTKEHLRGGFFWFGTVVIGGESREVEWLHGQDAWVLVDEQFERGVP